MQAAAPTADALDRALAPLHLAVLGEAPLLAQDGLAPFTRLALIGPVEPGFWPDFAASPEAQDGHKHPMDRWSRRVLGNVASALGGQAVFPFGGPPFQPFHTWALRSGRFWSSPVGFLVHDEAGLWVSFRGAIALPGDARVAEQPAPCTTCAAPCLTACPVNALGASYDVAACKAHLRGAGSRTCMVTGCQARAACPVGHGRRLPAQAQFHMEHFL